MTLNRGREKLWHKEKIKQTNNPGPISNLNKLKPRLARSVSTKTARRKESMSTGRAMNLLRFVCVMSVLPH